MSNEIPYDEKIASLLIEFEEHRHEIKQMIKDLEVIRENINTLLPTNLDKRYLRYFEEKVKSMTNLFNSLLEMRKEIAKSVKDEIEIRRRLEKADEEVDLTDMIDIRKMADQIEDFQKEKERIKNQRVTKIESVDDLKKREDIEIPGVNTNV